MKLSGNTIEFSENGFEVDGSGSDLILTHKTTGKKYRFDSDGNLKELDGLDLGGGNLTNVGSLDAEQLSREGALIADNSSWAATGIGLQEDLSNVTATSYTSVGGATGVIPMDLVPDGATVYGRFICRMAISSPASSGDSIRARPVVGASTASPTSLTELTTETDSEGNSTVDSGWVEITSLSTSEIYFGRAFEAEVDSGTGKFSSRNQAVFFDWRVD